MERVYLSRLPHPAHLPHPHFTFPPPTSIPLSHTSFLPIHHPSHHTPYPYHHNPLRLPHTSLIPTHLHPSHTPHSFQHTSTPPTTLLPHTFTTHTHHSSHHTPPLLPPYTSTPPTTHLHSSHAPPLLRPCTSTPSSTQQCQLPHTTALTVSPVMLSYFSSEPSAQSRK